MREALLKQIDDLRAKLPEHSEHDEVLEAQLCLEQTRRELRECELRLQHLMMKARRWEDELQQRQSRPRRLQCDLLSDLQGLVQGQLFQDGSAAGARFFTQSLVDFAHARRMGEMTVEACIRMSADPMMLRLKGRTYCWVEGNRGCYFFHPDPVDREALVQL